MKFSKTEFHSRNPTSQLLALISDNTTKKQFSIDKMNEKNVRTFSYKKNTFSNNPQMYRVIANRSLSPSQKDPQPKNLEEDYRTNITSKLRNLKEVLGLNKARGFNYQNKQSKNSPDRLKCIHPFKRN